jgi:predicted PP-loop superfamily ATPase
MLSYDGYHVAKLDLAIFNSLITNDIIFYYQKGDRNTVMIDVYHPNIDIHSMRVEGNAEWEGSIARKISVSYFGGIGSASGHSSSYVGPLGATISESSNILLEKPDIIEHGWVAY